LRTKWRTAKAALRATKAEAEAEAKRLQREAEELAVKAAITAAANAKREAGIVGPERSTERPIQTVEERSSANGEQEPIEREAVKVKVLRVCPNPRLVLCAFSDGGLERRVLVRVGRNRNFTCGMELKAIRPARETEPWVFEGKLPRLRGRWRGRPSYIAARASRLTPEHKPGVRYIFDQSGDYHSRPSAGAQLSLFLARYLSPLLMILEQRFLQARRIAQIKSRFLTVFARQTSE
jgi:hypothetical protein